MPSAPRWAPPSIAVPITMLAQAFPVQSGDRLPAGVQPLARCSRWTRSALERRRPYWEDGRRNISVSHQVPLGSEAQAGGEKQRSHPAILSPSFDNAPCSGQSQNERAKAGQVG